MVHARTLPLLVRGEWIPMTWEEFLDWSPDEGQSEWVDGRGIAYVSNSDRHVQLVVFLTQFLGVYVRVFAVGQLYVEQMLMRLPSRPSGRMPDAFVVGQADKDRVREYWFEGPALLAVEILSEDSADRDLREKRDEYARGGVREYLILDARPDLDEFTYLRLDADGRYQAIEPDAQGRYHSAVLPGFWLDPDWFRQDPLPDIEDLMLAMAPEAYEAWLIAKIRARRAEADTP